MILTHLIILFLSDGSGGTGQELAATSAVAAGGGGVVSGPLRIGGGMRVGNGQGG